MGTPVRHDSVAICSVSEMARRLGLSRARFYQLVKRGVFPPPLRCGAQRPSYPSDLQEKCLAIRKTRVGFNGQPVLFNRRRPSGRVRGGPGGQYDELAAALKNMGLKVSASAVRHAAQVLYPSGQAQGQDPSEMLRNLFKYFGSDCPKSV
jgi:predicted DNA-binding transcriptional regulator AlpA